MRYGRFLKCIAPVLVLAACDDDGITGPRDIGPAGVIRFINVVADTGTVDFRFIDRVENLPTLLGVEFRDHSGTYQQALAGNRPTRVFPTSTDPALTQIMLVDTVVSVNNNGRYTFVYAGQANGNQDRLAVFEDAEPPTPPAGSIAIKALHAAFGTAAVDVYVVPVDSLTQPTPADFETEAVATISGLNYLSQTAHVNVPVRPTTGAKFYRFVVTAAGSDTELFASTPNLPGEPAPAGATYGPQPGVQISGSVLTLVLAPGAVPGSRSDDGSNTSPSAFLIIDKPINP